MASFNSTQQMHRLGNQNWWPGQRIPGHSDAELAYRPLDSATLEVFKHALSSELGHRRPVEYLKNDGSGLLLRNEGSPTHFLWPAVVLVPKSDLAENGITPSRVQRLVAACADEFVSNAPFLRDLCPDAFSGPGRPQYLNLAMACIGSLMHVESDEATAALWWCSLRLLIGQLEVDNREARKMDLLKAWIFLETYGHLSADRLTWKRTSMAHGFVETAMLRLVSEPWSSDSESIAESIADGALHPSKSAFRAACLHVRKPTNFDLDRAVSAYFLLIDLLRSIHFRQPATLASSDYVTLFSSPPGNRRRTENTSIDPDENHIGEPDFAAGLHEITIILARIHTIAMIFEPLLGMGSHDGKDVATFTRGQYIPFSASAQLTQMKRTISDDLTSWKETCLGSNIEELAVIYHFCRMYLALPSMQILLDLSGYEPRSQGRTSSESAAMLEKISDDLRRSRDAFQHAWEVLDAVSISTMATQALVWRPIMLFCASLVVWGYISVDDGGSSNSSLRVLELFQSKLAQLHAPCCRSMSATLEELKKRKLG